ncbi:hypothetical protein EYF80_019937 [Liparis tanakae]|uniref:Uncharacterized protein n=1 Tax=Liparis tanakae TaxID=230148 RepID=A0A4Z2HVK3_9TELE|nr:hypothetical protein EYF80_019937 [Liparis tanakae]
MPWSPPPLGRWAVDGRSKLSKDKEPKQSQSSTGPACQTETQRVPGSPLQLAITFDKFSTKKSKRILSLSQAY